MTHRTDGSDTSTAYELVEGMLAVESPQRTAARIIELVKRGEVERARELMRRRAEQVSETLARELAAFGPSESR